MKLMPTLDQSPEAPKPTSTQKSGKHLAQSPAPFVLIRLTRERERETSIFYQACHRRLDTLGVPLVLSMIACAAAAESYTQTDLHSLTTCPALPALDRTAFFYRFGCVVATPPLR
uniref:Uncharacterized protein n=1 Tax=Physcomitrium patens TaxID=3218 RepID=A0A2K1INB5_PHYPA|nr:hypothetical protein PHYPA_027091 [Physcomitrium patens]